MALFLFMLAPQLLETLTARRQVHLSTRRIFQVFNTPYGLDFDSQGNLYVASTGASTIRKIDKNTDVVTTIAGANGVTGVINGQGTVARFYQPYGLAIDSQDNIYLGDYGNSKVRKIVVCDIGGVYNSVSKNCSYPSCPIGYELAAGKCRICPDGYFKNITGLLSCNACPLGSVSVADRSNCSTCVSGQTYRSNSSLTVCSQCPTNAQCLPAGFVCNAEYKLNSTLTGCYACPANQESNVGRTACNACTSQQYFDPTMRTCISCSLNQYLDMNLKACVSCPAGGTCNGSSIACNFGYIYNATWKSCDACPAGKESSNDRTACLDCPTQKYRPSQDYNRCIPCPSYGNCSTTALIKCMNGFVKNSNGDGCDQCPIGQDSSNGLTCQGCPAGYFKPSQSYRMCVKCPDGSSSCGGASVSCQTGFYYDSNVQCKRNDTFFALMQTVKNTASTVTNYVTVLWSVAR